MISQNPKLFPEIDNLEVKRSMMPADFKPNNYSVMCGRGKEYYNSIGNRRLRVIVSSFIERYAKAESKSTKSQIVTDVIDTIRSAGGCFVKLENGIWWEVGDSVAREKVGSQFRDYLHSKYKSSGKSKAAKRRASQETQFEFKMTQHRAAVEYGRMSPNTKPSPQDDSLRDGKVTPSLSSIFDTTALPSMDHIPTVFKKNFDKR